MNIMTRNHSTDTTISQLTTIASACLEMRKRSELEHVVYLLNTPKLRMCKRTEMASGYMVRTTTFSMYHKWRRDIESELKTVS